MPGRREIALEPNDSFWGTVAGRNAEKIKIRCGVLGPEDRATETTSQRRCRRTLPMLIVRSLSGVVLLLLGLIFMSMLDGVGAQEGMTMLHHGAFSHQLSLVDADGSQAQLAVTDEDVLYLGITVDQSECQPSK